MICSGSSPLSRGIPPLLPGCVSSAGIIPALAGNTAVIEETTRNTPDHPRSRGEYFSKVWNRIMEPGSSPLSRGIRAGLAGESLHRGIIPALAGNTANRHHGRRRSWDHPRSRGEYGAQRMEALTAAGSSPLSRGILLAIRRLGPTIRIIPALAGNTVPATTSRASATDHPRSRGEYYLVTPGPQPPKGSSPLSRGILGWFYTGVW